MSEIVVDKINFNVQTSVSIVEKEENYVERK